MLLLAGDSDGSVDRLGLADDAEHEVGGVGAGDGQAAPQVLAVGGPVGAGEGLPVSCGGRMAVQSRPLPGRVSSISARSAKTLPSLADATRLSTCRMKNPSPGSRLGGLGLPGVGTVETGAALTATIHRTPAACIAVTMARVPCGAKPASAFE